MTLPQALILAILAATMGVFIWGRWRHDIVALTALVAAVVAGVVPGEAAFAGFAEPAVITVAAVLVLSRSLQITGAVDILARAVLPAHGGAVMGLAALLSLGALLSAFMNNVGAMALLMPVAVRLAQRLELAPGQILMPLAFATILGGMVTLIGTPPNLIVSGLRADAGLGAFDMFDFAPVGLPVTVAGVAALALMVWRIVPARAGGGDTFIAQPYATELQVPEASSLVGKTLSDAEDALARSGAQVTGLVRGRMQTNAPRGSLVVAAGDILMVEGEIEALTDSVGELGLTLEEGKPDAAAKSDGGDKKGDKKDDEKRGSDSHGIEIREFVVRPGSALVDLSPERLRLRSRLDVNILAVSRSGHQQRTRLRRMRLQSGDLLLVQGPGDALSEFASETGSVPLAERGVSLPDRRKAALAVIIMAASVALAAFDVLPTAVAFTAGVVASIVARTLPLRQLYESIDWSVVVLLGALIPVAGAMDTTGAAALLADTLVRSTASGLPLLTLGIVVVVTMLLSNVINNAATAAVMCPIALSIAAATGANPDSYLMGVAIGASAAFLTPIGHQNNTLILGPGGFRFGDFWKPGILITIIVLIVTMIALPVVWPL